MTIHTQFVVKVKPRKNPIPEERVIQDFAGFRHEGNDVVVIKRDGKEERFSAADYQDIQVEAHQWTED